MSNSESASKPNSVSHTAATSSLTSHGQLLSGGAQLIVGTHKCEIIEHLAEGGFAHIYKVKFLELTNEMDSSLESSVLKPGELACLKRVIVPDENGLNELRNEVETMKQLQGAPNIVQYYDSNASRHPDGTPGYEILLLMELCPKKSLLDYMNKRLTTKLSEGEILKIMYEVTNGVAQMHYLPTPLIHRDIKIENVLVDKDDNFKLCDFGSTSGCFPIVTTHRDIALLTNNIYIHTTPQYRSPEMIDLYRCIPINEKSDIWALGIFLYKLLFYTTPFELTGQFAILHSKYEFPQNTYSSKLINLVIIMLAENPSLRPNIYQVMHHVCSILKVEIPFKDKYGLGAYDFTKYSQYHSRLQDVQYQMFNLYAKDRVSSEEIDAMNSLFIQNFEIAPKQPMDKVAVTENQAENRDDVEIDIAKMDEYYPTVEKLESGAVKERDTHLETPYSYNNASSTSDVSNKSLSSTNLNDNGESQGLKAPPIYNSTGVSMNKHKLHNPFQAQFQADLESSKYYASENQHFFNGTPPARQSSNKASYFLHDTTTPPESFNKTSDDVPAGKEPIIPSSNSKEDYLIEISPPRAAKTTDHVPPPVHASTSIENEQKHLLDILPSASVPVALVSSQHSATVQTPNRIQHNSQRPQQLNQKQQLENKQHKTASDLPQPKLPLTFDRLDLSKNSLSRESDTELEESIMSDESISLNLRQSKGNGTTSFQAKGATSEFDIGELNKAAKAPQRRSLDLKYQEINFSVGNSTQSRKKKTSFTSRAGRKSADVERTRNEQHTISRTPSKDETKESKRRSFFGVFK